GRTTVRGGREALDSLLAPHDRRGGDRGSRSLFTFGMDHHRSAHRAIREGLPALRRRQPRPARLPAAPPSPPPPPPPPPPARPPARRAAWPSTRPAPGYSPPSAARPPVFPDPGPQTLTPRGDPGGRTPGPRPGAILPVPFAGQPRDIARLLALARPRGIAIVE